MARKSTLSGKPKRGFMDGYKRYDPSVSGFGSAADWAKAAEALADDFELPAGAAADMAARLDDAMGRVEAEAFGLPPPKANRGGPGLRRRPADPDLALLGLEAAPADAEGFKAAFRRAAMAAHPDRGGSGEKMKAVLAAWARVKTRYGVAR